MKDNVGNSRSAKKRENAPCRHLHTLILLGAFFLAIGCFIAIVIYCISAAVLIDFVGSDQANPEDSFTAGVTPPIKTFETSMKDDITLIKRRTSSIFIDISETGVVSKTCFI